MSVPDPSHQVEATRTAILEAAAQLLLERRNDGFSVQTVADRAGLTHRTVYRYFPTRLELMAATARSLAPHLEEDSFAGVSTIEEWIDALGPHLAGTEANLEIVRSLLAAILASEDPLPFGQPTADRDSHRWEVFRRQFRNLPEDDARRTFATLRHLTSSTSYVLYRLRFGMSPAEAIEAIRGGATQIVEQAALRDRAMAREERR
jgi:AcrR family transcriptional regulator